jgi:hypothetical protein
MQRSLDFITRYAAIAARIVANILLEYTDDFSSEVPTGQPPLRGI